MPRSLSRRLPIFFTARTVKARRRAGRSQTRVFLEALEPRTLLSNLWYVNSGDTGTQVGITPSTGFLTIQAAINVASAGDTIVVESGAGYNESDTIGISNLTIEADSGPAPVLDGTTPSSQSSPGFTVTTGTTGVTIEGLTIQNFTGTSAVVVQSGASLALSDDTISGNTNSSGDGGGIANYGTATFSGDTVSGMWTRPHMAAAESRIRRHALGLERQHSENQLQLPRWADQERRDGNDLGRRDDFGQQRWLRRRHRQ